MAEAREQVKGSYLYYKNRPLVREKDTICYGDFTEKCVLLFEIMSYVEKEGGEYKIIVERKAENEVISGNNKLSSLAVDGYELNFNSEYFVGDKNILHYNKIDLWRKGEFYDQNH